MMNFIQVGDKFYRVDSIEKIIPWMYYPSFSPGQEPSPPPVVVGSIIVGNWGSSGVSVLPGKLIEAILQLVGGKVLRVEELPPQK